MDRAETRDASAIALQVWEALAPQGEIVAGKMVVWEEDSRDNGAEGKEAVCSEPAEEWHKLAARVDQLARELARCWLAQEHLAQGLAELRQQVPSLAAYVIRFEGETARRATSPDAGEVCPPPMATTKEAPDQSAASEPGQWQTVKEVARALNIGEGTVRRYIRQGKLPAVRLPGGRGLRLRRADVERCLGSTLSGERR